MWHFRIILSSAPQALEREARQSYSPWRAQRAWGQGEEHLLEPAERATESFASFAGSNPLTIISAGSLALASGWYSDRLLRRLGKMYSRESGSRFTARRKTLKARRTWRSATSINSNGDQRNFIRARGLYYPRTSLTFVASPAGVKGFWMNSTFESNTP